MVVLERAIVRGWSSVSAVLVISEVLLQPELSKNVISFLGLLVLDQVVILLGEFLVFLQVVVDCHRSTVIALDFIFALDFLLYELR